MTRMDRAKRCKTSAGFTIIEVSLSLTFIAFIILFLTASMLSIISTYNKGVWLSQVNQALRQMNADIVDTVKYSASPKVKTVDGEVTRLCANGVTYAWNLQSWIDNDHQPRNRFAGEGDANSSLRLVRIQDKSGAYCSDDSRYDLIRRDSGTMILLGKGTILQEFNVVQGIEDALNVPLLSVSGVISTEGVNAPSKVKLVGDKFQFVNYNDNSGAWQCGDWIDNNGNNKKDTGDEFKPSKGSFCAKADIGMQVYERGVEK